MTSYRTTLTETINMRRRRNHVLHALLHGVNKKHPLTERELMNLESKIGGQLFGPVPKGTRREFFNVDAHTWIWHEEAVNPATKRPETKTVKYEVQDDHILKVEEGAKYTKLAGPELTNFVVATHAYYERTMREIYNRDPKTGKRLA